MTTAVAGAAATSEGKPAGNDEGVAGAATETKTAATETKTPAKAEETPKPAGDEGTAAAEAEAGKTPATAPEKYELKVPTGEELYGDAMTLGQVEAVAKKNGWTNDEAQAALEEHIGNLKALSDSFLVQTTADKDYGGEKLPETQRLANRAIDAIRPVGHPRRDSFLKFMNRFGGLNHIEVVSALADLGKQMGEDRPGQTRSTAAGGSESKPTEKLLYDHPTSQG